MDHFAGLDVSVKDTSICIVDDTGRTVRELKVASEPEALLHVLGNPAYHFKRIGLEAGPLSQWLFSARAEAGLPVICVETRHMRAGLYRPVHVKTLRSQKLRMLLTHGKLLQSKTIAIDNDLRGTLRNFGLKVGMVGKVKFEARIRELVENLPDLAALIEPLLIVRRTLREQFCILHRRLLAIVRDDEVCRRLMTTPGVGPVVALTYRATVDVPARFRRSKSVGAVFRQQFRHDLRAGRFTMEFASSAPAALQRITDAAGASIILILSDINMPGMSGLELLPKAKAMRPDVPIIMITAYGDAETKRKALENGAEALLTKPIDFGALRSEIDSRVERAA